MHTSLILVLILVLWLVVLVPMVFKNQRPISRSGEAFEETRVLHAGGSGSVAGRRAPTMTRADVHVPRPLDEELELADAAEDTTETSTDAAAGSTPVGAVEEELLIEEPAREPAPKDEAVAAVVEGTVVTELPALADPTEPAGELADVANEEPVAEVYQLPESTYDYDESYAGPADVLHPTARAEAAAAAPRSARRPAEKDATVRDVDYFRTDATHLSEEDLAFARSRSGRGGWDPERDNQRSLEIYTRRQRTLVLLALVIVVGAIIAFNVSGWAWLLPVLGVALAAAYLVALRAQVKQEQLLRQQRIRHLRRARLGVRHDGVDFPRRRLGAEIVEVDDVSPDYEYLPVSSAPVQQPAEADHADAEIRRTEGSDDRSVG